jgi:uncharacterized protein (TIGR03083 family)
MTPNEDSAAAYVAVRERMTGLMRQASSEELVRQVPACPDWTVQDLLAHAVGVAVDVAAGRIEGAGSDPWTAAQVSARKDCTVDDLLTEWAEAPVTDALLTVDAMQAAQVVFDLATHEHDLRGALLLPGERASEGVDVGWEWATRVLGQLRDGYGEGGLVLTTSEGTRTTCGSAPVDSGVTAERFELFRAMTGRRSTEQVAAWQWEGEPAVERLCLLPARSTPLQE